jgi:hypothetical protein
VPAGARRFDTPAGRIYHVQPVDGVKVFAWEENSKWAMETCVPRSSA